MADLENYKRYCDEAGKTLEPLLNGTTTLNKSNNALEESLTDSVISGDLYEDARELVDEQRKILDNAKLLRERQPEIMATAKRAMRYYFMNGDQDTRDEIEMMFRDAKQYEIQKYNIKKLAQKLNTITFEFNRLRGATTIPEGLDPAIEDSLKQAARDLPILKDLSAELDAKIATAKAMINRLNNTEAPETEERIVVAKDKQRDSASVNLSESDFSSLSSNDIAASAAFVKKQTTPKNGETRLGFTYYARNDLTQPWDTLNPKLIAYGTFRKLLEKGKIRIWADANQNNAKDPGEIKSLPYWIWYDIGSSGVTCHPSNPLDNPEESKKRTCKKPWLTDNHFFKDTNVMFGVTGKPKSSASSEDYLEGNATYPPFTSYVRVRTTIQIGGVLMGTAELRKTNLWIFEKEKKKILKKTAFWETGMEHVARSLLNATLETPKRYTMFLKRHLFLNANRGEIAVPPGFKLLRRSKKSGNYWKNSFWIEFAHKKQYIVPTGGNSHKKGTTRISCRISARINLPKDSESLKEFFKRKRENAEKVFRRVYKRYNVRQVSIPNSDFSLMFAQREPHNIKNGYGVPVKKRTDIRERILMIRNNLVVQVEGSGYEMLGEDVSLETTSIARRFISKFNKPRIK